MRNRLLALAVMIVAVGLPGATSAFAQTAAPSRRPDVIYVPTPEPVVDVGLPPGHRTCPGEPVGEQVGGAVDDRRDSDERQGRANGVPLHLVPLALRLLRPPPTHDREDRRWAG